MRFLIQLSVIAVLFIGNSASAGEQALSSMSVWVNQSGSIFTIDTLDPTTNQFTGTYINHAQRTQCQGTPYAVTGYIDGVLLGWSVDWRNAHQVCNSITSWTGYYASGKITTAWNLVYMSGAGGTIKPGIDIFTSSTTSEKSSLIAE